MSNTALSLSFARDFNRLTPLFHSTYLALCCCFLQGAEAAACPCDLMKESPLERGCREVVLWQTGTGRHKTEEGRCKNMLLELYVSRIELKPKTASNKLMEENWWSNVRFREVENTLDNHRRYRRSTTEEVALSVFKDCTVFFHISLYLLRWYIYTIRLYSTIHNYQHDGTFHLHEATWTTIEQYKIFSCIPQLTWISWFLEFYYNIILASLDMAFTCCT